MKDKKSFVLYHEIREPLDQLSMSDRGELFTALLNYSEFSELPTFQKGTGLAVAFSFIKNSIDRNTEQWQDACEKRAEAGRKGGLARAQKAKQNVAPLSNAKQCLANQADSDSVSDSVSDNDSVSESESISPTHAHGIHHNVMLSNEQFTELKRRYPQDWHAHIDNLSGYMKSTGKTYADHYATLLRWAAKDAKRPRVETSRQPRGAPLPTATDRGPTFDLEAFDKMTMRHRPLAFELEEEES